MQDATIGQHEVDHLMASANYALYNRSKLKVVVSKFFEGGRRPGVQG
jgi:hypothetical protein